MAVGKYSINNPLSDILSIEGAFVSSFVSDMPPMVVKVYLYLVYVCNHPEIQMDSIMQFAQALNCSVSDISNSMEYLSKKHLLNYTIRPFSFEILSASTASKNTGLYNNDSLTAYADYFAGIRALFPEREILNSEYDIARDWIEIFGLSVETALMLISHCIQLKDNKIKFSYIDKVAQSWANDGIKTIDKAEEFLMHEEAKKHEVSKLLLHLGIKRTPTVDEITLYRHWTEDFGFDLKAIKAACHETTKSLNPSLAYVNRILENLHALGLHTEKQIKAYLAESDTDRRLASVVLFELGEKSRAVTQSHLLAIKKFKDMGFEAEILIFIARTMCQHGFHTFNKYISKLDELGLNRYFTQEEISAFFNKDDNKQQKQAKNDFKGRNNTYGSDLYADVSKLEV